MQVQVTRKSQVRSLAAVVGLSAMTLGGFAMAEGEGAELASQITGVLTTVAAIGTAVLAVYGSIKIFRLIRAAL
ncbi:major capsid protein [Xanthomonas campestris]|uniref:major capsid protein n=1 Tax=Xanthomonas campestris TaxID=339 RepID=UPI0011C0731B|nr:major capsid protein [Xanthomonas campestris]